MSPESRLFAGILLVVLPTVMFGGTSLLRFLTSNTPGYVDNGNQVAEIEVSSGGQVIEAPAWTKKGAKRN